MRKPKTKLAYYRMKNFMSQDEVAKKLGISQPYYGRLERNPEDISIGMALKLKEIFNANNIDDFPEKISAI